MDDTPGTGTPSSVQAPRKRGRGVLWAFIAVVLAFGAGFGWQFYEADQVRAELSATQQELLVERLRVRLGQAAMAAQAAEYETARVRMSDFFTRLTDARPLLPEDLTDVAEGFLAMRDEVITGLSRSNPEFAGVLFGMLEEFRGAAGLEPGMVAEPPAPEAEGEQDTSGAAEPDTGMTGAG